MSNEKLREMIQSEEGFLLGLSMAFKLGDEWILSNICDNGKIDEIKIWRGELPLNCHLCHFTVPSSKLIISTGGTYIYIGRKNKVLIDMETL